MTLTDEQACKLYRATFRYSAWECRTEKERKEIANEMRAVLAAPSNEAAAEVIKWWGCWDKRLTATRSAARIRRKAAKMFGGKP